MNLKETQEFTRITDALATLYPKLSGYAATTAVNFFKDRIRLGIDINNNTFAPRSNKVWQTRGRDKKSGRAVLVDTGTLIRDIQKLTVNTDYAIVGTTRISAPYAKAHNEGFKGDVTQQVKAHDRRRWGKQKIGTGIYSVKSRKEKTKTVKVQTGTVHVKAYQRKISQNLPQRQFMGNSTVLDRAITTSITKVMVDTIKNASSTKI